MASLIINPITSAASTLEKRFPNTIPYIWGALSAIILTTSNLFVKKLSQDMGSAEILIFRSLQIAVYTYTLMSSHGMQFHYPSPVINRLLIARALAGTGGVGLAYYGISMMPLSDASVINQVYPVFTGILATLVLGENYEKSQLLSALICLVGVVFIVQPPVIFGSSVSAEASENGSKLFGAVILLLGGMMASVVEVLVKKVGSKTNSGVTTFVFGLIATMIATVVSLFQGFVAIKLHHISWFFWLGSLSFVAQVLRNRAFVIGNAGRVSNMAYFGLVAGYVLDIFVLGNSVNFLSLMGGLCILSCMFIYMYRLHHQQQHGSAKTLPK